jgi:polysaccharide biosynthesis/export protein
MTAIRAMTLLVCMLLCASAHATDSPTDEYVLGAADVIHITVFQNPDLTSDVRVSEAGTISFPLIGNVRVVGLTLSQAEEAISKRLVAGHFVAQPQVNILPQLIRGSQVTVVGHVNRPGRYPLETTNTRVSDVLAEAGGIDPLGSDKIVLIGTRDGIVIHKTLEVQSLFAKGSEQDEQVHGGDTVYLAHEDVFYVYGEVRNPGVFRLTQNMTVMQGLAVGGGPTSRGSQRHIRMYRQNDNGSAKEIELHVLDPLQPNDVIYVGEGLF